MGILKRDSRFKFHYAAKKLIMEEDVVLDIGANLGYFSKLFARLNPKGTLYAFEPIPLFYERLSSLLSSFPHVEVIHSAMGATSGTLYMVMPIQKGVLRTGLPHVIPEEEAKRLPEHLEVPVIEAKTFLSTCHRLDYIKCDIEGYEWTVFSTLGEALNRLRPIVQIEISERHIEDFCHFFSQIGYQQLGLYDGKLIKERGAQRHTSDFLFVPTERVSALMTTFNL
ncbi:MAG: FkbM family methyltransferase [Flavobacteriales bacterium]